MKFKLGKLKPKLHPKTLQLNRYLKKLTSQLPPVPPTKSYWEYKLKSNEWGMLGNDEFGDCTCAAKAHLIMSWTAHTGQMVTPTLDEVLAMYAALSPGFDPRTGANDNGASMTDSLNYLQTTGLSGHKIDGWAQLDPKNHDHVKLAIFLFGGIDIGVEFPNSAMDQLNAGQPWRIDSSLDNTVDGGHDVPVLGYGHDGLTCVTWGQLQPMTWEWFDKYCDEAYAPLSLDWLKKTGLTPSGLNLSLLKSDLQSIAAA